MNRSFVLKRDYCYWCGRYLFMLGPVCDYCESEPEFMEHKARTQRIERRDARKVRKGNRAPVMAYEKD